MKDPKDRYRRYCTQTPNCPNKVSPPYKSCKSCRKKNRKRQEIFRLRKRGDLPPPVPRVRKPKPAPRVTAIDRVWNSLFTKAWLTFAGIKERYKAIYKQEINLENLETSLRRMVKRGCIQRRYSRIQAGKKAWQYRAIIRLSPRIYRSEVTRSAAYSRWYGKLKKGTLWI